MESISNDPTIEKSLCYTISGCAIPGCKDPCQLVQDQVELRLELVQHRGRVLLQVLAPHGVVRFLQLVPRLQDFFSSSSLVFREKKLPPSALAG